MLGHVAQSVGKALPGQGGALKVLLAARNFFRSASAQTWTVPADGMLIMYGFGGGGSGVYSGANTSPSGYNNSGGGGGSAFKKTIQVKKGDVITINIPRDNTGGMGDGFDTTINWGAGSATAGGGKSAANFATGGIATGGDINRSGGEAGHPFNTSTGANGSPGQNGAPGGLASGGVGGGGGSGGFSDENGPIGGYGAPGNQGTNGAISAPGFPGGGGGATNVGSGQSNSWQRSEGAAYLFLIGDAP